MKTNNVEICLFGILGSLLFALKFAMSYLPNIEPVTLLLIVYTITFGIKVLYPLAVYILLEIFIYGFGFWTLAYFYIWLILVVVVIVISKITNKNDSVLLWSLISGAFGLIFGALYIPIYIVSSGFMFAITWWINGLFFDIMHCIANFILCLILFRPIVKIFSILKIKILKKER